MDKVDAKAVRQQAEAEVAKERAEAAKEKLKKKLRERDQAKVVLANLDREIEDLEVAISEGNA